MRKAKQHSRSVFAPYDSKYILHASMVMVHSIGSGVENAWSDIHVKGTVMKQSRVFDHMFSIFVSFDRTVAICISIPADLCVIIVSHMIRTSISTRDTGGGSIKRMKKRKILLMFACECIDIFLGIGTMFCLFHHLMCCRQ